MASAQPCPQGPQRLLGADPPRSLPESLGGGSTLSAPAQIGKRGSERLDTRQGHPVPAWWPLALASSIAAARGGGGGGRNRERGDSAPPLAPHRSWDGWAFAGLPPRDVATACQGQEHLSGGAPRGCPARPAAPNAPCARVHTHICHTLIHSLICLLRSGFLGTCVHRAPVGMDTGPRETRRRGQGCPGAEGGSGQGCPGAGGTLGPPRASSGPSQKASWRWCLGAVLEEPTSQNRWQGC